VDEYSDRVTFLSDERIDV